MLLYSFSSGCAYLYIYNNSLFSNFANYILHYFVPNRSMDRTLEESQQLDVLFEQMLASRQQQNQNISQIHSTNTQGLGSQLGMPPPLNLHCVSGYDIHTEEIYEESAELEYADESEEYCQESHTEWKGTIIQFNFIITSKNTSPSVKLCYHLYACTTSDVASVNITI